MEGNKGFRLSGSKENNRNKKGREMDELGEMRHGESNREILNLEAQEIKTCGGHSVTA